MGTYSRLASGKYVGDKKLERVAPLTRGTVNAPALNTYSSSTGTGLLEQATGADSTELTHTHGATVSSRNRRQNISGTPEAAVLSALSGGTNQFSVDKPVYSVASVGGRDRAHEKKEEDAGFFSRVGDTISGGLKGSAAGNTNALGTLYEVGQGIRDRQTQEQIDYWAGVLSRAEYDYRVIEEMAKEDPVYAQDLVSQQNIIDDAKRKLEAFGVVSEAQRGATRETQALADQMAASSQQDIQRAKDGLGGFGQFAVDVGVAGVQMAGDAATGMITGGNMLPGMAVRSFGSGAQEARQSGAPLEQQVAYGIGSAATEVLTEKISNIPGVFKKLAGKGVTDEAAKTLIEKAVDRFAKSDVGKKALGTVLNLGAGAGGEALEEFVSAMVEPVLKRATFDKDAQWDMEGAVYEALVGGALGLVGGAVDPSTYVGRNADTVKAMTAPNSALQQNVNAVLAAAGGPIDAQQANVRSVEHTVNPVERAVEAVRSGGEVTNSMARDILASAQDVASLGIDTNGMTAVQQRAAVKDAVGLLAGVQTADQAGDTVRSEQTVLDALQQDGQKNSASPRTGQLEKSFVSKSIPSYEELTSKPDLTVIDIRGDREGSLSDQRKSFRDSENAKKLYKEPIENRDTKALVFVTPQSISHSFSNLGTDQIGMAEHLGEIIEDAVLTHSEPTRMASADNSTGIYTLFGAVGTNNGIQPVKLKIKEYNIAGQDIPPAVRDYIAANPQVQTYASLYDGKVLFLESIEKEEASSSARTDAVDHTAVTYPSASSGGNANTGADAKRRVFPRNISIKNLLALVKGDARKYIPESAAQSENPSIGAADAGFDPYSQWQNQSEQFHPEGENAARPVDLPAVNLQGESTMRTGRTVMESANTPDARVRQIEQMYVDGALAYVPEVNADLAQKAAASVEKDGWNKALTDWTSAVRRGKVNADLVAMGATLLNNMGNSNASAAAYADLVADYSMLLHNAGQSLQAARIFKMLTPEGRLYAIQRSIDAINEQIKGETGVEMDTKLMDDYRNAETDEGRAAALDALMQDVADKVPSTLADKWTALRYVNMLGNFKTQLRNLAGNTAMTAMRSLKDEIGAGFEAALKAAGVDFERTKSATVGSEWMQAAKADFETVEDAAMGNSRYREGSTGQIMQEINDRRTIFKVDGDWGKTADSNAAAKAARAVADVGMGALEGYRKLTNWATDAGDVIFIKHHYARALAGYLKANGISVEAFLEGSVDAGLLDRARAYAIREAQEATFHDNNVFSNWVSKIGRRADTPKAGRVIAEGVAPFRKTPANVLVRAYEYSPLGFIDTVSKAVKTVRGEATASDVINSAARSLGGTGLLLLGLALRSRGLIRATSEDGDEDIDALMNRQDYSLTLGEHSYTMDWLSPTMLPVFMGAVLQDVLNDNELTWADVDKVIGRFADPVLNMSMVSGVDDALKSIKFSDNGLLQLASSYALSYLTQGFTNSIVGQVERTTEPDRMTTYTDQGGSVPVWLQKAIGKASAKTPGWDYQQAEYLDEFGQKESNGSLALRAFENMISPGYYQHTGTDDPVRAELEQIHNQTGTNPFPDTNPPSKLTINTEQYELTPEERRQYQKTQGQFAYQTMEQIIASQVYARMDAAQKADMLSDVTSLAGTVAKAEYAGAHGVELAADSSLRAVQGGIPADILLAFNAVFDDLKDDGKTNVPQGEVDSIVHAFGAAVAEHGIEDAGSRWKAAKKSVDIGVPLGDYLEVQDKIANLAADRDQNGKPISGSKKEKVVAIIDAQDISDDQKDTWYLMQGYGESTLSETPWHK